MSDETKNPFWEDANNNGIPDKLEAIGGLVMKFIQGVIKTLQYLKLDAMIEGAVTKIITTATERVVARFEDKWLSK